MNGSFLLYTDMKKFLKNLVLRNRWSGFEIQSTLVVSNFAGRGKNSRQPEFELNIWLWKPEVITGSQGMVKMNVKRQGAKLKPSCIAENKQIKDT